MERNCFQGSGSFASSRWKVLFASANNTKLLVITNYIRYVYKLHKTKWYIQNNVESRFITEREREYILHANTDSYTCDTYHGKHIVCLTDEYKQKVCVSVVAETN